ncbi:hypothetical protein M0805_008118 [Coniferiporia weirii]|nr:hypothetical protein M0805_008118 [Coniferiporia weirii]
MDTSRSPSLTEEHLSTSSVSGGTSELSSDATVSDLPGPGRLLGRLYSTLGRGLENRIGSISERVNRRRRENSLQEAPALALTVPPPRHGPPSIASSSADWRAAFSSSTVSSDKTATNLPGPGRLLGKLYSKSGLILENRLNKIANGAGRGPDACAARIKSALLGEPYPDEMLVYLWAKADANDTSTLLPQELILFRECRQLIHYAYSPLPATHNCAMRHIAKLAVEDRYLYTLFNALGAPKHLTEIRKRELKRLNYDSDWSIPHCRQALICLSNNEVNTVLHRHLRLGENAGDQPLPLLCRTLIKFLREPELSFLALRYIAQIMGRWNPLALSVDLYTDCLVCLADLTDSLPHIVDWECVDDIYAHSFKSYVTVIQNSGDISDYNVIKWNRVFSVALRNAHRFPLSVSFLNTATNIDELLDKNNPRNIRADADRIIANQEAMFFPNDLVLSQRLFVTAAIFPSHILNMQASSESQTSRFDNLSELVSTYVHSELSILWRNLSIGPDVVMSEILMQHIVRYQSPIGGQRLYLRGVPKEAVLRALCLRLVSFLTDTTSVPSPNDVSRAILRVVFVIQLNRYCKKAMTEALLEAYARGSVPESVLNSVRGQLNISLTHDVEVDEASFSRGPFQTEYIHRHRAKDGSTHLRHEPYRRGKPCRICLAAGTWEDPPDATSAERSNEVFCSAPQQLMILEVPAGGTFSAAGHVPILAGVNAAGEREYIASVYVDERDSAGGVVRTRSAWTTVVDGSRSVLYEDEAGVHMVQSFWVLVLRFDAGDETEVRTRIATRGLDVTGQCYWRAGYSGVEQLPDEVETDADHIYDNDTRESGTEVQNRNG